MTVKPDLTRVWASGAPVANVEDPDVTTAGKFAQGWVAEVPTYQNFNYIQRMITQALAHFNEEGIGSWDSATTYPENGLSKGSDGFQYLSYLEQNGNDPVSDGGENWGKVSLIIEEEEFSVLQAMSPTIVGMGFICQERANARYILKPQGYVANPGDLVFTNGFVGALQIYGVVPLKYFETLAQACERGVIVDMTGYGEYAITSTETISNPIRLVCRDDSFISGYDGKGISFTGSEIYLDGVNVSGFYDGTDQNETNYSTAFIVVETGTTVDSITVKGGSATNCRSVIRSAGSTDTTVDTSIITNNISIYGNNVINGCPLAYYFRCRYTNAKVIGNTCLNAIGASMGLTPYEFYIDGLGFADSLYQEVGTVIFSGNYANTIVNRTTTGDSTSGNGYECHVLKASGEKIIAKSNIIVSCTGINFDCESFYTKARYVNIDGNILVDGGTNEGAINVKGTAEDSDGSNTSPFGEYSQVCNNIIAFTFDSYDNDGTIVNLDTVGVHAAVPHKMRVINNTFIGVNEIDIIMDGVTGGSSSNSDICVNGNISYGNKGVASIRWRGAFENTQCNGNVCDYVQSDGKSFTMIDLLSVTNRGLTNKSNEVYGNTLRLGYETANESGFIHCFLSIDSENYDFNGIFVKNNTIDIADTDASVRPIYTTAQTGSPSGLVYDLTIKDNNFMNDSYEIGPVYFGIPPESYELDIDWVWESTANTPENAMLITHADDTTVDAELRVYSRRTDTPGFAQRDISNFIGYTSAGTLNIIDNTAETSVGNATGIGVTFATTTNGLRVRISGEDSQTWDHKIKLLAKC